MLLFYCATCREYFTDARGLLLAEFDLHMQNKLGGMDNPNTVCYSSNIETEAVDPDNLNAGMWHIYEEDGSKHPVEIVELQECPHILVDKYWEPERNNHDGTVLFRCKLCQKSERGQIVQTFIYPQRSKGGNEPQIGGQGK